MASIKQEILDEAEVIIADSYNDIPMRMDLGGSNEMEVDPPTEADQSQFNFSKKYICVEYPGIIKNVDKMIETLGGIESISEVLSSSSARRLELRFRPDDIYGKPACGDKSPTLGVVLKVKIKRIIRKIITPSTSTSTGNVVQNTETSISSVNVMGICEEIFKFDNFADFQYLPLQTEENGDARNIYEELIPDGPVGLSWLENPTSSYFLPPHTFSRIDTVEGYKYSMSKKDKYMDKSIIGPTRQPRSGFTKLCSFADPVPERAFKGVYNILKTKMIKETALATVKKLFESRPIWSRQALMECSKISHEHLKSVLPTVAFYYTNGPWRVMWVRYGFDPRIDPSSRIYQTLDFRAKSKLPYTVSKRRNLFPVTKLSNYTKKRVVLLTNAGPLQKKNLAKKKITCHYTFKPGMIPHAKQMFYQYCDLYVPEIQAMLARLPDHGPDAVCNEKTGWLPSGFDERCREILHEEVGKSLAKKKSAGRKSDPGDTDTDDEDWLDDSDDSDND